jgi:lactoylglutathione lyase
VASRVKLYGINHVALKVDDVERAVELWRTAFDVRDVDFAPGAAFIDMGDQFVALFESGDTAHFGLVVDDKEAARDALSDAGAEALLGRFVDVRDPSGNRIQLVQYDQIQFTKDAAILSALELSGEKTEAARAELRSKGLLATAEAATRWAEGWTRAWATHDVELVASLYADDAVHVSAFFREPQPPADYAAWAFSDEERAEVWFAEPAVAGDRAFGAWWAISRATDGRETTLAGISDVRFGADGLVVRQRDYWNEAEGALPPPDDWGPVVAHEASA